MRKSLGNKRKYITESNCADIIRIYGDFTECEYSKIFANEDFGFRRIIIERPLRVSYHATDEGVERAMTSKAMKKVLADDADGSKVQSFERVIREAGAVPLIDEKAAIRTLNTTLAKAGIVVDAGVFKVLVDSLVVRDQAASAVRKAGKSLPDPDLRDAENVPLKEDVHAYFEREVKPHVGDAWIDETKSRVGYEVAFTRYFYVYTPPRHLTEIDDEIRELERSILALLSEVTA